MVDVNSLIQNESGQSVLEVVFVLPVLFLFVALLYKVNLASQIAINNAKSLRSQMFILTGNSPEYPRLQFRFNAFSGALSFAAQSHARMLIGVADPSAAIKDEDGENETLEPVPQTMNVARKGTTVKGSEDAGEVKVRTQVRVRNTAAICTQFNGAKDGSQKKDWDPELVRKIGVGDGSRRWPFGKNTVCKYEDGEEV